MTKLVILIFAIVSNLPLVSCAREVHWNSLPQVKSISLMSSDHAWLVTAKGDLLRTTDGGKNWQTTPANTIGGFQAATMLNDKLGFAVNNRGRVWNTADGGETWAAKSELTAEAWHFNESNQIQFTDESHGWIIEALSIWHTQDGASSWRRVFSPVEQKAAGQPGRAFFIDSQRVWVSGSAGEIYSTSDAGRTWLVQTISGKNSDFTDIFFINEKTGWLVGYTGGQFDNLFYRTDDGGKTWKRLPANLDRTSLTSLHFTNEKEGWACGEAWSSGSNRDSRRGILMRTADGGESWQSVFTTNDEPFFDRILFVDQRKGWLFARDRVYRTDDTGKFWLPVLKLPPIKSG